jgi:hypothetical protein
MKTLKLTEDNGTFLELTQNIDDDSGKIEAVFEIHNNEESQCIYLTSEEDLKVLENWIYYIRIAIAEQNKIETT